MTMARVDLPAQAERRKKWQREVIRPRKRVAARVADSDQGMLSAVAFRRRVQRAEELAAHLYLDPSILPANGASARTLMRSSTIEENLQRDAVHPCFVWQANTRAAIRAVLEDLDEPGIAEDGGHPWTVMGDRTRYIRPGAYVLAASRRSNTPAHGVLFASRGAVVEPYAVEAPGALPMLQIELDYVYVCRRMRRRGVALALAAAVVEQAKADIWHLSKQIVGRPKRDRKLAIWLSAENHTFGGDEFVRLILDALEGYLPITIEAGVGSWGVLDRVDWL